MSPRRLYLALLASIAVLVLGLAGGAYGVSKILAGQAGELRNDRLQLRVLDVQQAELDKAKRDVQRYKDLADISKSIVPQDKDQVQAVRQIANIADANGIPLSSITFPNSTLGLGNVKLSQLSPVKDISGVYSLDITVMSDQQHAVPYPSFLNFMAALEQNRRTALVTNISITPNTIDRSKLSFTMVLQEYIKP